MSRQKLFKHRPRHSRSAFTLIEVVVAALIVMILAAVAVPSLSGYLDTQRAQATATTITALMSAISNGNATGFDDQLGTYPGHLSDLVIPITTAKTNSCGAGNPYSAANVTAWTTSGPYYTAYLATTGTVTPLGLITDAMTRSNGTGAGFLLLTMPGVLLSDITELDQIVDGSDGSAAGAVRWVTPSATLGAGYGDITYWGLAVKKNKC